MQAADMTILLSPGAQQMQAYCYKLGYHFGLPLESVEWGVDWAPLCAHAPYKLTVKVGPLGRAWFWFTRDEVTGYGTAVSTTRVQARIRADLDALRHSAA